MPKRVPTCRSVMHCMTHGFSTGEMASSFISRSRLGLTIRKDGAFPRLFSSSAFCSCFWIIRQ